MFLVYRLKERKLIDSRVHILAMCKFDLSHSIFACPLSGSCFVLRLVSFVDVSNLGHKRIIRVGISEQATDTEKHLWNSECGWPLILEDIQANATVWVDVWVIDSGSKVALGWLEWVVSWEVDVQEENTASIWWIIRSHDCCLPVVLIFLVNRSSRAVGRGIFSKVNKFLLDSL